MSVFAVERQRRFSCRCRAAWRTRFSCCLMFGISEKDPRLAGRAMVATPLPMLPPWTTPSGSGRSGGWSATAAAANRASRRTSRARRPRLRPVAAGSRPSRRRRSARPRPRRADRARGGALDEEAQGRRSALAFSRAPWRRSTEGEGRGLVRSASSSRSPPAVARHRAGPRDRAGLLSASAGPVNAFEIAFLIPNTVRALVADSALSAAFVPVFSDLLVKGEGKRAWRVASSSSG